MSNVHVDRAAALANLHCRRYTIIIVALVLAFTGARGLVAWSLVGHTLINRAAIAALPDDGPIFLKRYADWIGARSTAPDSWRDAGGTALSADEGPNHFWEMERLPTAMLHALPASR